MPKPKLINFELIAPTSHPDIYAVLDKMLRFHGELAEANIALAWRKGLSADKDGHLILCKCMKISDMHNEIADWDFVILLNREAWEDFSAEQRDALMDHELCHAARAFDEEGDPKVDERGRPVWRMRKHDIEEFQEIVSRHGCYKRDLELFAAEMTKSRREPLFTSPPMETAILTEPETEGAALAQAAVMGGTHQRKVRAPREDKSRVN